MAQGDTCSSGTGCQACGGYEDKAGSGVCHVCNGSGMDPNDPGSQGQTNCPRCGDKGLSIGKCQNCGGDGCL